VAVCDSSIASPTQACSHLYLGEPSDALETGSAAKGSCRISTLGRRHRARQGSGSVIQLVTWRKFGNSQRLSKMGIRWLWARVSRVTRDKVHEPGSHEHSGKRNRIDLQATAERGSPRLALARKFQKAHCSLRDRQMRHRARVRQGCRLTERSSQFSIEDEIAFKPRLIRCMNPLLYYRIRQRGCAQWRCGVTGVLAGAT
jgi:hypothetical protein